jgi:simple sugar transport system permease protein
MMDIELITNILFLTVRTGTPLLLVALGELVCEKSGVLNLGQEGMMLMGAVLGFLTTYTTGSLMLGFIVAAGAGVFMSVIFAFVAVTLNANQVATGLALTIFGTGLSAFIGSSYEGKTIEALPNISGGVLESIPLLGKALFAQDLMVYFSWFMFIAIYLFFRRGRTGLKVRAAGENPAVGSNLGLPVLKIRYFSIMFGGAMAGLAGGYLSLAYTPLWTENMTAGRGWIALALVVFASWRVGRIILGAYLFGFASIMHLIIQGFGFSISSNLLATLPYVATIVVLVFLSKNVERLKQFEPMALGKPWHKTH